MAEREPYPTDVSDEEWAFVAPYLAGLHYLAFACLMLPYLTDAMNIVQNML